MQASAPVKEKVEGQLITFDKIDALAAGQSVEYRIDVQAMKAACPFHDRGIQPDTHRRPGDRTRADTYYREAPLLLRPHRHHRRTE